MYDIFGSDSRGGADGNALHLVSAGLCLDQPDGHHESGDKTDIYIADISGISVTLESLTYLKNEK